MAHQFTMIMTRVTVYKEPDTVHSLDCVHSEKVMFLPTYLFMAQS